MYFFFNDSATTEIYTLSLHDALPISQSHLSFCVLLQYLVERRRVVTQILKQKDRKSGSAGMPRPISYAVFCLKKKTTYHETVSGKKEAAVLIDVWWLL